VRETANCTYREGVYGRPDRPILGSQGVLREERFSGKPSWKRLLTAYGRGESEPDGKGDVIIMGLIST
jgi:hypothetical protein